jgi:hypothetical protein
MLATHCCACGRPPVDAGWQLAKQLTHAVAVYCQRRDREAALKCADAIQVVGFPALAQLIRGRFPTRAARPAPAVTVTREGSQLVVRAPWSLDGACPPNGADQPRQHRLRAGDALRKQRSPDPWALG